MNSEARDAPYAVHVWHTVPEEVPASCVEHYCRRILPAAEIDRCNRFHFARDRLAGFVTRALVRYVLSQLAPVDPTEWRFSMNRYGRPAVAEPRAHRDVLFNLSHTAGFIVCAATRGPELGIDVECVSRPVNVLKLAESVFAPLEIRSIRELPARDRQRRFFEYWTLKEAYIKARGMGVSLPLERFAFLLQTDRPISIQIDPSLEDSADRWEFSLFYPTSEHQLALALERTSGGPRCIVHRKTVPFSGLPEVAISPTGSRIYGHTTDEGPAAV